MSKLWRLIGAPISRTRAPMIHPAPPKNHCGHGDRPNSSLVTMWTGPQNRNQRRMAPMRAIARAFTLGGAGSAVAVEGDAVQLHPMIDETEAEFLRNPLLKCLELFIDELDFFFQAEDGILVSSVTGVQTCALPILSFGPFQLGDLEVGLVEEVRTRVLKD